MKRRKFDVGIVVPLAEEFRYVVEITPQLESLSHEGTYFYRLDFGSISAVCCLVGQMGPLPALHATNRLFEFVDVKLVVVLGLGGALDDGVAVGDVVIASEVNEFQANSKAEPADNGYEVRYSGRHWPLEFQIREAISHFEFSSKGTFSNWQTATSADYVNLHVLGKETVCGSPARMHFGPIASGNVVVASSAFVSEVMGINRKFVAIDMEAAGVAFAAAERIHPIPCLVVRGISDGANESKKLLEEQGKGAWRRYCVRNATSLLRGLLTWKGFQDATGLRTPPTLPDDETLAGELLDQLKPQIGGPWIVGAAFGIYPSGPSVVRGDAVVAMDLSRLRVIDPRVGELLNAAEEQKEILLAGGQLQAAVNGFAKLITDFRSQIDSPEANRLLQDFDRVVSETLRPENDEDEQVRSLLMECNRLEEEVGMEAVIELLEGRGNLTDAVALRERYVGALASTERWAEIVQFLGQLECTDLLRSELEHGVFACAKCGSLGRVKELMRRHQDMYDDNAGRLFRSAMGGQYPQIVEQRPERKK
jgi:nucleoside phosphorylase